MNSRIKVLAINGSYRKGGIIDTAIDEILAAAKEQGAETRKIYLVDKYIEFCTNCRTCAQEEGSERGECILNDDMDTILDEVQNADALVLGSPINFGTVSAIMKRFIERLICFVYWPWGMKAPKVRNENKTKKAVVVASSAAPAFIARLSSGMVKLLKNAAGLLGARNVGVLFIGLAALEKRQDIGEAARKKARQLGKNLACR
jgi:multimeric flavodoxin WrbA